MRSTAPIVLACLGFTAAVPVAAAPPTGRHTLCGHDLERLVVLTARHDGFQRRLERERRRLGSAPVKSTPAVRQAGHTAVMDDDGTLVIPPNLFDLQGRGMQFLRRPKGMSAVRTNLGYKQLIGERIELGDDDSVLIRFPEGFQFPFGDRVYSSVWVNSNGNLTFGAPDPFLSNSVDALQIGPPRLAPLYADLDPSAATGGNGVYVGFPPHRVRVTWRGVPEFGSVGSLNTFQVTLFGNGRSTFVYGDEVETSDAVVGISAFDDLELELMDYSEELPYGPPRRTAIAEEFSEDPQRDDVAILRTFFQHFEDVYDHVIIWLDFGELLQGGAAFAFELTLQNEIRGIGEGIFDFSDVFGSRRVRSLVQMGTLSRYPASPDLAFRGDDSTMSLLGHETGHRWLAKTRVRHGNVGRSTVLLGRQLAHWSFFMDSEGSVMEGNDWQDQNDGTFLSTGRTVSRFSELDQYVMGLVPPGAVPDFYYIDTSDPRTPADNPAVGAVVEGERVAVSIDDVLAAEGPRVPSAATADKSFRMAFVLVGRDGEPVSQESIDHLETIRQRWETWFPEATDFRGEALTTLFPK